MGNRCPFRDERTILPDLPRLIALRLFHFLKLLSLLPVVSGGTPWPCVLQPKLQLPSWTLPTTTLSTPPSPSSLRPLLGLHLKLLVVLRPTTVPMTWKPQVRGGGGTDSRRIYRCFSGIYWWSRTKISSPRRYMYFITHRAT